MTQRTEPYASRPDAGFTLVELLVVVAIIGLLAGVVAVNLPAPGEDTQHDIEKMAARLQLSADTAILSGRVTGVEISQTRYRMMSRIRGEWVIDAGPEEGFALPARARLSLILEGEKLPLARRFVSALDRQPTLYFLPTGEAQLFSLRFESPDFTRALDSDGSGQLKLGSAQ